MKITEPKRLFDSSLKITENLITNSQDKKWIISDLWISNSSDIEKYVTLKTEYQGEFDSVKRTLLEDVEIQPKQTIIIGNLVIEPNEKLYAYTNGTIHAHHDTEFEGENNDLIFVSKESGNSGNNITLEIKNPQVINSTLSCSVDNKAITISLATNNTTTPTKAKLTTNFLDPNNDLTFTSKICGTDSNNISVELINSSAPNTTLSLSKIDWALTVTLGTDANGNIITTASALKDLINGGQKLVDVSLAENNDGTGFVRAMAKTKLNDGIDATVTTTANDVISLLKSNEHLDKLVYIVKNKPHSGVGILRHFTNTGTHNNTVNFKYGELTKYDEKHFGITGVDIIGYGRSI
ncbi:hypothetical protein PV797_04885 [Clostridiaceae bacterium M8S5]|nr:hypothetical protein PV797_04885 [Clostridiaceae bacterium M8S5]